MRIEFERTISLAAPVDLAWRFLSDVERVTACVPNLSDLAPAPAGAYTARASDRVGPFRVSMDVRLVVDVDPEGHRIRAELGGHDRLSQTRIAATLSCACAAASPGETTATIRAGGDLLGPVATLGAGPIRRRLDEIFEAFVANVTAGIAAAEATSAAGG